MLKKERKNPFEIHLNLGMQLENDSKSVFLNKRCRNSQKIVKMCCPYLTTLVSGSPIIQNGKLVGAVTHVTVNDPTKRYGIFIENMLGQMGDLAGENTKGNIIPKNRFDIAFAYFEDLHLFTNCVGVMPIYSLN